MKAIHTIFALLVIALLAAQPALAGSSCVMSASAPSCMADCSMTMVQMAEDCPMAAASINLSYGQDCCRQAMPQSSARIEVPAAPKAVRTEFVAALPLTLIGSRTQTEFSDALAAAASPPRYLLLQVFRI